MFLTNFWFRLWLCQKFSQSWIVNREFNTMQPVMLLWQLVPLMFVSTSLTRFNSWVTTTNPVMSKVFVKRESWTVIASALLLVLRQWYLTVRYWATVMFLTNFWFRLWWCQKFSQSWIVHREFNTMQAVMLLCQLVPLLSRFHFTYAFQFMGYHY